MTTTTAKDELTLISHTLCPYVQRVVAILEENGRPYKRIDIDLGNKPDWFLKISPLGKVPVLVVNDDIVLFESNAISEFVNDTGDGSLLSTESLPRAKQRAWIEFASDSLSTIGQLYNATDVASFREKKHELLKRLAHLEGVISPNKYFSGEEFSLVDAAFAPLFRYLDAFENLLDTDFLQNHKNLSQWRLLLKQRPSIKAAVTKDYPELLLKFIAKRESYLGDAAKKFFADRASHYERLDHVITLGAS